MVELEPAPLHPTTSTTTTTHLLPSFNSTIENGSSIESISSDELASLIKRQIADESFCVVVLDCRQGEEVSPMINGEQLIRMPSMLMRRLKTGKLATTSISPLLSEPQKVQKVVLIPDTLEDPNSIAVLIVQTLIQNHFQLALFQENLKSFAQKYPDLVLAQNEEHENEMNVSNGLNFRLFNDGFKYEFKARRAAHFPAKVMPHVYLGNVETAKDCELLKKYGITHIINVTNDLPNYFEHDPDFHYLRIPVDDTYAHNLAQYFPDAISFIEQARSQNSSVLVHCMAGISRSVTISLAFLIFEKQCTLDQAFDILHKQNHSISPNFNFMKSLLNWEKQILKQPHHRASSHPQQNRIQHQYDYDSGTGSSMPSSSTSTSSNCSSA